MQAVAGLSGGSLVYASLDLSAWRAYEGVEEQWIRDRHELLVREAPAAAGAAALDLEVRLADLHKRALEFRHLLAHDQQSLRGGIWQMASLSLPPVTQKELLSNQEYRKQSDRLRALTDALRKHSQYGLLQHAQMRLWKTPQYREIHRRYTGRMQELQLTWGGTVAPSLSFGDSQ
jgi:hypothetical protein